MDEQTAVTPQRSSIVCPVLPSAPSRPSRPQQVARQTAPILATLALGRSREVSCRTFPPPLLFSPLLSSPLLSSSLPSSPLLSSLRSPSPLPDLLASPLTTSLLTASLSRLSWRAGHGLVPYLQARATSSADVDTGQARRRNPTNMSGCGAPRARCVPIRGHHSHDRDAKAVPSSKLGSETVWLELRGRKDTSWPLPRIHGIGPAGPLC